MFSKRTFHLESIILLLVVCVEDIYSAAECPDKSESVQSTSATPIEEQEAQFSLHNKILDEMKADNIKHELR